jgi:hypothetical protein
MLDPAGPPPMIPTSKSGADAFIIRCYLPRVMVVKLVIFAGTQETIGCSPAFSKETRWLALNHSKPTLVRGITESTQKF